MKPIKPFLRNGTYQFRKRVPRRYAAIEPLEIVQLSLHTDSYEIARRKSAEVWGQMVDAWEAKLEGQDTEGEQRLAAARDLAQKRGFRFLHTKDVATLPIEQILKRLDMVPNTPTKSDLPIIEAALGTPKKSGIKISETFDEFYEVADDRIIGKSEDQVRRHKNPRRKATRNFIKATDDKPLSEVTTEDMFAYRKWLSDRVKSGQISVSSANKEMSYLLGMWKPVSRSKGFSLGFSTEGLMLKDATNAKTRTRPPFSTKWIREKLLAPGALNGLNRDARLILIGMVNTGYRPSEGAGLLKDEIRLDSNVPHIIIQPNEKRTLKNPQSERIIPLTGVSLEAIREGKAGFPRYADNSASLSATVNKFLSSRGLLETPKHSMYGLRHSMEDRMLEAGIDERIRMDVLGHQISRERYGRGGQIEFIHEQLLKVAI
ncbi:MAG: integrase [Rhodobacteraceae bacterium]|nr:MAG: integrase [Paracoccaceae bacterium]